MKRPPQLALILLRLLAGRQIMEEIEGDLHEDFLDNLEQYGPAKARYIYIKTALSSIRPYLLIHNKEHRNPKPIDMLIYHTKMALRSFAKNKVYTLINLFGLTAGLTCSLAIALFIIDQSQTDAFHKNGERIYRLESQTLKDGTMNRQESFHSSTLPAIAPAIPEIEAFTRFGDGEETLLLNDEGGQKKIKQRFLSVDSGFFDMFSFGILEGDVSSVFTQPEAAAITRSAAQRFFGDDNPIGKTIYYSDKEESPIRIVAVLADPPGNSSLKFDFIISMISKVSMSGVEKISFGGNFSLSTAAYVLLSDGADPAAIAAKVTPALSKYTDKPRYLDPTYSFQGLAALKYDTDLPDENFQVTDPRVILMFSIIAIFVIALAVTNYINLTSAQAIQRGHSVGIRRVVGASRKLLVKQFLTESFLVVTFSALLALLLLEVAVPYFESVIERPLHFNHWQSPWFLFTFLAIILFLGLLAGGYPAVLLSRVKYAEVVKGRLTATAKGAKLRKALVVFQFTFSIALIIGASLVQDQLDFVKKKTLSYSPEQVIIVKSTSFGQFSKQYKALRAQVNNIPGVVASSISNSVPGDEFFMRSTHPEIPFPMVRYVIDEAFLDLYNIQVNEGDPFRVGADSLKQNVLVNQSFAESLTDHEGDLLYSQAYRLHGRNKNKVIGIVDDFHFESLHNSIQPAVFAPAASMSFALSRVSIKVETNQFETLIGQLSALWEEFFPNQIFDYEFLDRKLELQYSSEYKLAKVFGLFTTLAIILSCLGLFGLSTHMAEVKMKEVGIRKVLGASTIQLMKLLSSQVFLLVGLAALVASPVAYYFAAEWMTDFAYRVDISAVTFALTIGLCFVLAGLTISWHTLKTSRLNPANVLRNE